MFERIKAQKNLLFFAFSCLFVLCLALLWLQSHTRFIPYIGIITSTAGLMVGAQQLYIYYRLGNALLLDRKNFSRDASVSLLLVSASLLFLATSQVFGPQLLTTPNEQFRLQFFYKCYALLGVLSLYPLTNMVVSYLNWDHVEVDLPGFQQLLRGRIHYVLHKLRGKTGVVIQACWWLLMVCIALIIFCFVVDVTTDIFPQALTSLSERAGLFHNVLDPSAYFILRPTELYYVRYVAGFSFLSITCLLFFSYFSAMRREDIIVGFSRYLVYVTLFVAPVIIRVVFDWSERWTMRFFSVEHSDNLVRFVCILVIVLASTLLRMLLTKFLQVDASADPDVREVKIKYRFFFNALLFMLFCYSLIYLFVLRQEDFYAIVFITFGFFVLGIAYMTTLDLKIAMERTSTVMDDYLTNDFKAAVGHEIHNPLHPVKTFLNDERLRDYLSATHPQPVYDKMRQELLEFLPYCIDGIERVQTFTAMLKKEGGFIFNQHHLVNIVPIVKDLVRYKRHHLPVGKGIKIRYFVSQNDIQALVDPMLLGNVLRILLDNAIEATCFEVDNTIRVAVMDQVDTVTIVMSDTGAGMGDVQQKAYGQKVQQSDKPDGSGVGVLTAKKFTKQMHGTLALIDSTLGKGTTIQLKFQKNIVKGMI